MLLIDSKMAWRNIWRNPRRSVLSITAVAFSAMLLVFMLSVQFGSYETMINAAVKVHTGHLQIQHRNYHDNKDIRLTVDATQELTDILEETPAIAAFTFRASAFALVSSARRTYGAWVMGIDPIREASVSTISSLIRQGGYLMDGKEDKALVGELLAENLKVDIGDELVLLGQGKDGSVAAGIARVAGIFSSGQDAFDRVTIQISLPLFQNIFSMPNSVHAVVVLADSLKKIAPLKVTLAKALVQLNNSPDLLVYDWSDLMPGLVQAIKMDLFSGFVFYIILIIVVAFSILNTFLMAVFERTREFGVLLAIGTTPGRLVKLLLLESSGTTLLGIIVGAIAGSLVTWYFQVHGIAISGTSEIMRHFGLPERIYPQLSLLSVSIGNGLVLLITMLAALYPTWKVRRLHPAEAMLSV
jgi:ABC-type lipoprotein release transport system permease subunit